MLSVFVLAIQKACACALFISSRFNVQNDHSALKLDYNLQVLRFGGARKTFLSLLHYYTIYS